MRIKGYPLFWYLSSRGRVKFMGVESKWVRKSFPTNKHLDFLFYGLNNNLACTVAWPMGVNYLVNFSELGASQFLRFNIVFRRRNMQFGFTLKNFEIYNYKRLFRIRCRRGRRLLQGLPVRGQRTHTNAVSSFKHGRLRRKEVFAGKEALVGTRAERKARYLALQERNKALRLKLSRIKVKALLRVAKKKRKVKEKARAWIMSKQKSQMERARKKWQAVTAKKKQQRMKRW